MMFQTLYIFNLKLIDFLYYYETYIVNFLFQSVLASQKTSTLVDCFQSEPTNVRHIFIPIVLCLISSSLWLLVTSWGGALLLDRSEFLYDPTITNFPLHYGCHQNDSLILPPKSVTPYLAYSSIKYVGDFIRRYLKLYIEWVKVGLLLMLKFVWRSVLVKVFWTT